MYTTILGTEKDKKATLSLSRALKQSGQITIDNHYTVMQSNTSDDPVIQAKTLTEYIRKQSTTSLIVICSDTICSLLANDDTVTLQIIGTPTMVNAGSLKQLISEEIKRKIILISFSSLSVSIPGSLQGCEHLILTEANPEVEYSQISLAKLQSAIKRRNKELGMHQ